MGSSAMRLHHWASVVLHALAGIAVAIAAARAETATSAPPPPVAPSEAAEASKPQNIVEVITSCLHDGFEIFMSRDEGATCVPRGRGGRLAQQSGMPYLIADIAAACRDPGDQRHLNGDVVKRVLQMAEQKSLPIAPTGIRIIGGLFCTEVDIVGLDLPYSLVLDYMASDGRLFGRNIQIRGDLSIDGSFLRGGLVLTRSHISGSVYAENSVVRRVAVFDSQVQGSWHQTGSIILNSAEFRGLSISGDLGLAESAVSMVSVLSAQITGGLVLNNSEARCAYHIRGSSLGYMFGENVGFGAMTEAGAIDSNAAEPSLFLPWWSKLVRKPLTKPDQPEAERRSAIYTNIGLRTETPLVRTALLNEINRATSTQKKLNENRSTPSALLPGCVDMSRSENAEFYFLSNRVQTTVCLRSFAWLRPKDATQQEMTIVSLNGTNVTGNLIIDLWSTLSDPVQEARALPETRILEAIGVSMGALIFDFTDNARRYVTYLDGLKFNQVHTASVNCEFQRDQEGATAGTPHSPNGGVLQQPSLPSVQDVMRWLEKNGSRSSQPFSAFVEAFEHEGADASDLKVARKTADLCEATARWLTLLKCRETPPLRSREQASPEKKEANVFDWAGRAITAIPVLLSLGFQWTLYALADHGIRPGKVVWWVIGVLIAFFAFFWSILGIVGFEPKEKSTENAGTPKATPVEPWPLTFLFLFDRLLPLYKIREEHYAIARYYRRANKAEISAGQVDPALRPQPMRYVFWTLPVIPLTDVESKRADKSLLLLRVIGLVLTVFLLAAINALTR
jgi:hypothetical protein